MVVVGIDTNDNLVHIQGETLACRFEVFFNSGVQTNETGKSDLVASPVICCPVIGDSVFGVSLGQTAIQHELANL